MYKENNVPPPPPSSLAARKGYGFQKSSKKKKKKKKSVDSAAVFARVVVSDPRGVYKHVIRTSQDLPTGDGCILLCAHSAARVLKNPSNLTCARV